MESLRSHCYDAQATEPIYCWDCPKFKAKASPFINGVYPSRKKRPFEFKASFHDNGDVIIWFEEPYLPGHYRAEIFCKSARASDVQVTNSAEMP